MESYQLGLAILSEITLAPKVRTTLMRWEYSEGRIEIRFVGAAPAVAPSKSPHMRTRTYVAHPDRSHSAHP